MPLGGTSSYGIMSLSHQAIEMADFDSIRITIADPQKIRLWSYGEVTKPETINYRTFKPERDGLFCSRIFGPIKDYECLCGKYKRIKYKGIICEKCGVEVTSSKVRRERMGHIELAAPVSHVWFLKSLPSRIGVLLNATLKNIEKVLYFESYIITESLMSPLEEGQILSEEEYEKYCEEYGYGSFVAEMGAEAIQKLLKNIDLNALHSELREKLNETTSDLKRERIVKRLQLVDSFIESGNKPEWMILTVLPIIPPDIRPLVMLEGGRFATSDLNELYRRVINRNNRLKRLIELDAPDIIIKNEKRMLQESVDALLDNGRSGLVAKSANKRPFKSLSDMLKGKQGRFRQNLLGKRVDYSGRSVIVVGPELKLNQCGLPKKMALELFKPFIYSKLELYGKSSSIKYSRKMVENEKPEVWDILEEVIKEHPVLLNRAPTLHRLGIQAFEPILTEGKAIQLHPLVCAAFNADFDGDQMAVHIPLSIEAQVEARVLMMSTNNILSPANGKPVIVPSQDIILGLYYISLKEKKDSESKKIIISSLSEMEYALNSKYITKNDPISYRYEYLENGKVKTTMVDTTPGRVMLHNILPEEMKGNFDYVNKVMNKKNVTDLIDNVNKIAGQNATVKFCDDIMEIGFKEACKAGVSIGKDDMIIPQSKETSINNSINKVQEFQKQYRDGLITDGERYNKVIDEWNKCSEAITSDMMKQISTYNDISEINSIYMMADSGARGSETQIKQISAMRGLMAKPNGEIIETPIISNFKEGLTVLEYFTSAHGARKGLADTALKTANSGYLTRRLVDVAQDCIITENDCGSKEGVGMEAVIEDGRVISSLYERILGRISCEDVINPNNKSVIVAKNNLIDEAAAELIENSDVVSVKVRSVLTCKTKSGACVKCYGRDLATGQLVSVGEAIGVIAAQSIGEPGTQLTMRTFHIGGAASSSSEKSSVSAAANGALKISEGSTIQSKDGKLIVINRNCDVSLVNERGEEIHKYKLPYGAKIDPVNKNKIKKGDSIAEWDPYNIPIIAENDGIIKYYDLIENVSLQEKIDEATGISTKIIIDWRQKSKKSLKPSIIVIDSEGVEKEYLLSVGTVCSALNEEHVKAGDILARIPKESSKHKDITGGLPRVAELFEARKPKEASVMCEFDGSIEFVKDYKAKKKVIINPDDESLKPIEYMLPKDKHIFVSDGDKVKKGDMLVDGSPVPHDILRILGMDSFRNYMIDEIQKVYRMQGVKIDDKHIEIILSMMMRKVEVINPGQTTLLVGEHIDKDDFVDINKKAKKDNLEVAIAKPVLLGITKASLQTKSFISAASFQETTRILTESSIQGKIDYLKGIKENVIVGRLIPAGTGLIVRQLKKARLPS